MALNIHDIPMDVFFKYFNKQNVITNDSYENIYEDLQAGYYIETLNYDSETKYFYSYKGNSILSIIPMDQYSKFESLTGINLNGNNITSKIEYVPSKITVYNYSLKYLGLSMFDKTPFKYCAIISGRLYFNIGILFEGNSATISNYAGMKSTTGFDNAEGFPADYQITVKLADAKYSDTEYLNPELVNNQRAVTDVFGRKIGYLYENKPVQIKKFDVDTAATKNEACYVYKKKNDTSGMTYSFTESTYPLSIFEKYHNYARKIKQSNLYVGRSTRAETLICNDSSYPENKLIFVKEQNNNFRLVYKVNYKMTYKRELINNPNDNILFTSTLSEIYSKDNYVFIEKEYIPNTDNYIINDVFDSRMALTIPSAYEKDIKFSENFSTKNINIINLITNYIKFNDGEYVRIESEPYNVYYIKSYTYENGTLTVNFEPLLKFLYDNRNYYVPCGNNFDRLLGHETIEYFRQSSDQSVVYSSSRSYKLADKLFNIVGFSDSTVLSGDMLNIENYFLTNSTKCYCGFNLFNGEEVTYSVANSLYNSLFLLGLHEVTDVYSTYTTNSTADSGFVYKTYLYCKGLLQNIADIKNKVEKNISDTVANTGTTYTNINGESCTGFIDIADNYVNFIDMTNQESLLSNVYLVTKNVDLTNEQRMLIENEIYDDNPFARILQYAEYETIDQQQQSLTEKYQKQNSIRDIVSEKVYQTVDLVEDVEFYRKKRYFQDFQRYIVDFYSRYYSIANTAVTKQRYLEKYQQQFLPKLNTSLDENNEYKLSNYNSEQLLKHDSYYYLFTTDNDINVALLNNILKSRGL